MLQDFVSLSSQEIVDQSAWINLKMTKIFATGLRNFSTRNHEIAWKMTEDNQTK